MAHFILDKAHRYNQPSSEPKPSNASYDDKAGYWKNDKSGDAIVTNDGFRNTNTTKADRETGEDQKGE